MCCKIKISPHTVAIDWACLVFNTFMTVVKSFPAAVVYVFAITSMIDVIRHYDTSSLVYDLHFLVSVPLCLG